MNNKKPKGKSKKAKILKCVICGNIIKKPVIGKDGIKFDKKKCADYHNMNYPSEAFTSMAFGRVFNNF